MRRLIPHASVDPCLVAVRSDACLGGHVVVHVVVLLSEAVGLSYHRWNVWSGIVAHWCRWLVVDVRGGGVTWGGVGGLVSW